MPMMFERSADTSAVLLVLRGCNDEISYRDLAHQAGLTVLRAKQVLASARRALRSDTGTLFGVIRGVGLRRLNDADKVKKPETFKKRVFRGAGREIKDLSTISDFGGLSKPEQHSVTMNRTVLNILRQQANVKPELPKTQVVRLQQEPDVTALLPKKTEV